MADDPRQAAFNLDAPEAERFDALSQLQRVYMPGTAELIETGTFDEIREGLEMLKSAKIIEFPTAARGRPPGPRGMQSVRVDEFGVGLGGGYFERPGPLSPEMMRSMVRRTPFLKAIISTRQRQVSRFCAPSEDGGFGFEIRHVDKSHELAPEEEASIRRLTRFFQHCGFEWNPRRRKALRRDSFPSFMTRVVADSLIMDAASIETEMKRDRSLGIDGFYAVDGATIRLCPEDGYQGDGTTMAVQIVNGAPAVLYDAESLIYEPRNPTSDVAWAGYGESELDVLIQTITGFLNAMKLNLAGFDKNSIPRGILQLTGNYDDKDLLAFKRYMKSMTQGAENAFSLPVMVSKDAEGKAAFVPFGNPFDEMAFSKWMTLLVSLGCAVYNIAPDEINFEAFSNGHSSLSGGDTEEKLAASKDKGLRPLLSYFEQTFTDFIVTDFSDKYCFRWTGLDEKDQEKAWEGKKLTRTVDEQRAEQGDAPHENPVIGGAPLNPALIPLYQTQVSPQGQEFGGGGGDFGQAQDGADEPPGQSGEDDGEQDDAPDGDGDPAAGAAPDEDEDFGKALSTIYAIGR